MHEIGHLLGLEHTGDGRGKVMERTIGLGTRRLPTARDAAIANWLYSVSRRERRG